MTVRSYLWGLRLLALVAIGVLAVIVIFVDPIRDGILGQALFYVSLFFSVTGLAALFLFWLRRHISGNEIVYENLGMSFRQGALVALALTVMFFLESLRILVWWDAALVMAGVLLVELWFLSK